MFTPEAERKQYECAVVVFKRTSKPEKIDETLGELVERVEELESKDEISDFRTVEWSKEVKKDEGSDDFTGFALSKYSEFKEWAEAEDLSIEPFFEEHEFGDMEVVTFPVACLAIYKGEELSAVFPCSDGEKSYTVEDAISILEEGGDLSSSQELAMKIDE